MTRLDVYNTIVSTIISVSTASTVIISLYILLIRDERRVASAKFVSMINKAGVMKNRVGLNVQNHSIRKRICLSTELLIIDKRKKKHCQFLFTLVQVVNAIL